MRSGRGAAASPPAPAPALDEDLRRIERAVTEVLRIAASPKLHAARMQAAGLDLSRTELRFLMRLADGGARSVSKLGAELDVSQPTASRSLRDLEDAGLVARRGDQRDGRLAVYDVTATGRRVCARVDTVGREQLAAALADVPEGRRREIAYALVDLADRLRQARVPITSRRSG